MCIWCQFFPSWIPFEHSNFSLRLQPHSPIKPDWSDLRDLNFDCIQFSGFRTQWCNARSSLRCPCTIDWQFSRPARLIFPSGATRPIGNIRTHRMRVETIFGGLPCRRSLTPRVSPSRAPVFSFTHYFQAPATQSNPLHLIGVLLPIRNSLAPDFRTIQNTHELGLAGFQFDLLPIFTRQWHSPANSASYLNFLFRKPKLKSLTKYLHVVKAVFSRNFLVVS